MHDQLNADAKLVLGLTIALNVLCGGFSYALDGHETSGEQDPTEVSVESSDDALEVAWLPGSRKFRIDGFLWVNMSKESSEAELGKAGKPVFFAPDIWFGVTDSLALGMVHSGYGTVGFYGFAGGYCLAGRELCGNVYDNVGVRGLYRFISGSTTLAADLGITFSEFGFYADPTFTQIRLGVRGSYRTGMIRVDFNPAVWLAANWRDWESDVLLLPAEVNFLVASKFSAGIQSGLSAPFGDFDELWQLPFSVGVEYRFNETFGLGGRFSYPLLAGASTFDFDTTDLRNFEIYIIIHS